MIRGCATTDESGRRSQKCEDEECSGRPQDGRAEEPNYLDMELKSASDHYTGLVRELKIQVAH
jgi:hypothetical protein